MRRLAPHGPDQRDGSSRHTQIEAGNDLGLHDLAGDHLERHTPKWVISTHTRGGNVSGYTGYRLRRRSASTARNGQRQGRPVLAAAGNSGAPTAYSASLRQVACCRLSCASSARAPSVTWASWVERQTRPEARDTRRSPRSKTSRPAMKTGCQPAPRSPAQEGAGGDVTYGSRPPRRSRPEIPAC